MSLCSCFDYRSPVQIMWQHPYSLSVPPPVVVTHHFDGSGYAVRKIFYIRTAV
ncbi:Uncharacterised protein [Mycobacteroides abscessus subsp. abscessus]|nr:Uncharacterised protein [Mycobacteroides abscessus subsp. abscessus]